MKKLFALMAALCLLLCCVSGAAAEGKVFQIGIVQLVQHPALDAATKGFREKQGAPAGSETFSRGGAPPRGAGRGGRA